MPMKEARNEQINENGMEIAGTLFTVYSIKSENAKISVEQMIKKLILNNIDSLKNTDLSA